MRLKNLFAWSLLLCGAIGGLCVVHPSWADAKKADNGSSVNPQGVEFFETHVRPLLFTKCQPCHGAKQQMGGIRLDSRDEVLKSGANGAVVTPGEPEKSALLNVVHYDGAIKMPPAGKLKPEEIAALTEWVKSGAIWPADKNNANASAAQRRPHWAFQPIANPRVPTVKDKTRVSNPIDAFILAKLEPKNLTFAPPADRRTLIRRVSFDLTGLPPTPAETDAFLADKAPNAYEKVVDRLLESPR